MAIAKLLQVENVGRFVKLSSKGDVQFQRLTLIYGENGHGKSTIAGLLRSLATGDPSHVVEKTTLGGTGAPRIKVLLDGSTTASFDGKSWDRTYAPIEIFDATFVRENVYAGDAVDPEHRKNLYEVVVGASGVATRNRIDSLDSDARQLSEEIRKFEGELTRHIHRPFELKEFLGLAPEDNVDEKLRAVIQKQSAARDQRRVLERPTLAALVTPQSPREIQVLLQTQVERIAEDAAARVRAHIDQHLGPRGEQWIREGVPFSSGGSCPFCGQDLSETDIVNQFARYFSGEYEQRIVQLDRAQAEVERDFGERAIATFRETYRENQRTIDHWRDLADLGEAAGQFTHLEGSWRHLYETLQERIRLKLTNPSKLHERLDLLEAAFQDYEAAAKDLEAANAAIRRCNDRIAQLKQEAAAADLGLLEQEARRLRNVQIRQSPEIQVLCTALADAKARREGVVKEKASAKDDLVQQAAHVLAKHEAAINSYLARFGAGFTLTGTRPHFGGGKASSTYQLAINEVAVDLGDSRTKPGVICFRTALSTGDRSTLALSFFLAKLSADPCLSDKVVVLDDPLSSLDHFRATCTRQEIVALTERARQVIVLSHDTSLLKELHDDVPGAKPLQVKRASGTNVLCPWNIDEHCRRQTHRDHILLRRYLDEGVPEGLDLVAVAQRIRPLVEGALRDRYPFDFEGKRMMGQLIEAIEACQDQVGAGNLKSHLTDLRAVNEFARRLHHATQGTEGLPSDAEVQTFVKRAFRIIEAA